MGYWLNRISYLTFTVENCLKAVLNISHNEFVIHSEKIIELNVKFKEHEDPYRMCLKEKPYIGMQPIEEDDEGMIQVDEMRTWIMASFDPPHHYLPEEIQVISKNLAVISKI
jgi:hypothetical protein